MKMKKFDTEHFECEAKKVGEVLIGNETIPVYEISVDPKNLKSILNVLDDEFKGTDWKEKGKGASELEFVNAEQKLLDEIGKELPLFLAFIFSNINRYVFSDVMYWGDDNPIQGFIEAWTGNGGLWLTWLEPPTVVEKCTKDTTFQKAFEKWALAKYLQLVFGDPRLPISLPRYGSENLCSETRFRKSGLGNGYLKAGRLEAEYYFSKMAGLVTDLPEYVFGDYDEETDDYYYFNKTLSEKELERLYFDIN